MIDYTTSDVAAEVRKIVPHGVSSIVEVSPAQNAALDAAALGMHGTVAVYANNGGDEMDLSIRPLMVPNARVQFVLLYTAPVAAKERALVDIEAAVLDGAVRVGEGAGLPIHHFPLGQAAQAHEAVENGVVGKVLLDVRD